jgi:monoamine oxidase
MACRTAVDVAVVGAGISGLVCASALQTRYSVAVLEARARVGGRLLSSAGIDLGGSWSWPPHDQHVARLSKTLHAETVPQRLDGDAFSGASSVGNFGSQMAPCGPGAVRIRGGYATLPLALAAALPEGALELEATVVSIKAASEGRIRITYSRTGVEHELIARRVVMAVPPGVFASSVSFTPALPIDQLRKQASTATWCGDWAKVAATFKSPFWRMSGASGVVSTPGPISIWWEGGGGDDLGEETPSLVGLGVGNDTRSLTRPSEDATEVEAAARAFVIETLGPAFGRELVESELVSVQQMVWITEPLTFAPAGTHRDYGHPLLRQATPWGLHFAGTETEASNGHVDGAIAAGERVASEVATALAVA